MSRAVVGLCVCLVVGAAIGCSAGSGDPLQRAALHQVEPGEGVDGPLAGRVAAWAGVDVQPGAGLFVGPEGPPAADVGWTRIVQTPEGSLWRRRDLVEAATVAVEDEPVPGAALGHPTFVGWEVEGRGDPGGELVFELFVRPPRATPVRPCVALDAGEARLDLGVFLDGRLPLIPGAAMRPLYRHRARVDVPPGWPGTATRLEGTLSLVSCRSGSPISEPLPVAADLAGRLAPRAALVRRSSLPDVDAARAELKPPRQSLHKQADGSIEVRDGPPLPRMLRGEAWGVVVLPPVDPRGWPEGVPSGQPLAPLVPQLTEAEASVVGWDAPASRVGRVPDGLPWPARRVTPETLLGLPSLGVDGLLLGPHRGDAGADGLASTVRSANRAGLRVDRAGVTALAGEGERAVAVRIVAAPTASVLGEAVAAARREAPGALVLVQVEADDGSDETGARLRAAAAAGEVDAVWTLGDVPTTVEVVDGVPVLRGWSPLGAASREGLAVRWYVAPEGVPRLDLVGLVRRGTQWERDKEGALRQRWVELAERSAELDTYVVVGKTVAVVDVAAHGAHTREPRATALALPELPVGPPSPPARPPRCDPPAAKAGPGIALGDGLVLEEVELVDGEVAVGEPVRVRLVWRRTGRGVLPAGRVQWAASGLTTPWRPTSEPCEGSWGFERWSPGERVLDEVALHPPPDAVGTALLQLQVRVGDDLARPASGERWISVGEVRVGEPGG